MRRFNFLVFWGCSLYAFTVSSYYCKSVDGGRCKMTINNTDELLVYTTMLILFIGVASAFPLSKCPLCGKRSLLKLLDFNGAKNCFECTQHKSK